MAARVLSSTEDGASTTKPAARSAGATPPGLNSSAEKTRANNDAASALLSVPPSLASRRATFASVAASRFCLDDPFVDVWEESGASTEGVCASKTISTKSSTRNTPLARPSRERARHSSLAATHSPDSSSSSSSTSSSPSRTRTPAPFCFVRAVVVFFFWWCCCSGGLKSPPLRGSSMSVLSSGSCLEKAAAVATAWAASDVEDAIHRSNSSYDSFPSASVSAASRIARAVASASSKGSRGVSASLKTEARHATSSWPSRRPSASPSNKSKQNLTFESREPPHKAANPAASSFGSTVPSASVSKRSKALDATASALG
mmetsp:Transcript_9217/g.28283  ORF Transcript_9217/g.28283 Transcript_9217/m.28283 type:complete len:317 (-) Transcript_9217:1228-2178(-)